MTANDTINPDAGVCPGCGQPVQGTDDLSATVSCGTCRATIVPGATRQLTLVPTDGHKQPAAACLVSLSERFLKRYELQNLLGSGTAGAVYMARHRESGAPRAVKILQAGEGGKDRFLREAKLLEAIDHPAVIRLYEAGDLDGFPYLVLEFAAGGSLRKRLETGGPFTPREALELVIPMLQGLQACHDKGVIHRDLKPENILLTGPTTAKIADLGVALLESAQRLTVTGGLVGTPLYMAPEQLQGLEITAAADIHAMALILYELLTGALPFQERSLAELLRKKMAYVAPPMQTLVPELPAPACAALQAALDRDPARRPRTADEFARELKRALADAPAAARPKPSARVQKPTGSGAPAALRSTIVGTLVAPKPAPRIGPREIQWIGIALTSVVLIAGAAFFASRPHPQPSPTPSIQIAVLPTPSETAPPPRPTAAPLPLASAAPGIYPPASPAPETPPVRATLEGTRTYGHCSLPNGVGVMQRFGELTHAGGDVAVVLKANDAAVTCFDPRTFEVKSAAPLPAPVACFAADPDGVQLFAGTAQGEVYKVSRAAGQPSLRLAATGEPITGLAALPGGELLVAHGSRLETRSAATGAGVRTAGWDSPITAVSSEGGQVAVALTSGDLVLFAAALPDQQRRVQVGLGIVQVTIRPGGQHAIACDGSGSLAVVDVASGQVTRGFKVGSGSIRKFAISRDGHLLVTLTDRAADLWDAGTGALQKTLETQDLPLRSVTCASLVVISADLDESTSLPTSQLLLFDQNGAPVRAGAGSPVRRCAYATAGHTLLTSRDNPPDDARPGLTAWDTATLAPRYSIALPNPYVLASDFAGKAFFVTEGQSDLEQRDVADGHLLRKFPGTPVMIDVASDDARLAMLTDAGEARLVDLRTAKVLWHSTPGVSAIHLGAGDKVVDLLRVSGPDKDAAGTWSRPTAVGEVWDPARNVMLKSQKLPFFGPVDRSAFRPVLLMPGERPIFGTPASQALAGLPDSEQSHIVREACPLSAASQVTLHRAGDHIFALRTPGTASEPARAILHWRVGQAATPDVWMPDRVSPFGRCELASLAVSPDGRRLAVGTSMGAVLELDVDSMWPTVAK